MISWIEWTATFFGFLCVVLTIRRNVWCWPTGLVQVLLFIVVFYDAKLYSDLLLHIVYVFLQFYGWFCWTRRDAVDETLIVKSLPRPWLMVWVGVTVVGTIVWGGAMNTWTDAALPFPDAFTTVASLVAQFLLARRFIQNWGFWICVDVVAIWVYFTKQLNATATLYITFLILATIGLMIWHRQLRHQDPREATA